MRYAPLTMLLLMGCGVLENDVDRGHSQANSWDTPVTYTTADIRIITQRQHPVWDKPVVCAEPSPDVAKALSTAFQLIAQGGNSATSAGVGGGGGSAEAVMELAGRTTALLALRDGLFRACEAFSNGVIGADAYAHILSRYGKVMTTLFLGQDITGVAGAAGHAAEVSPTINIPQDSLQQGVQQKGGGNPSNAKKGGEKTGGNNPSSGNNPQENQNSAATVGVSAGAADAIRRINEDYHSDRDLPHLLIVACLNEKDPSRYHKEGQENTWLTAICDKIKDVDSLQELVELSSRTPKSSTHKRR